MVYLSFFHQSKKSPPNITRNIITQVKAIATPENDKYMVNKILLTSKLEKERIFLKNNDLYKPLCK